jgi:hypothetical protein
LSEAIIFTVGKDGSSSLALVNPYDRPLDKVITRTRSRSSTTRKVSHQQHDRIGAWLGSIIAQQLSLCGRVSIRSSRIRYSAREVTVVYRELLDARGSTSCGSTPLCCLAR